MGGGCGGLWWPHRQSVRAAARLPLDSASNEVLAAALRCVLEKLVAEDAEWQPFRSGELQWQS